MKSLTIFGALMFCFGSVTSVGAIPKALKYDVSTGKSGVLYSEGVFIGGRPGKGFSLLSVRRKLTQDKKMDRWVFDLGDREAKQLHASAPYFQVAMLSGSLKMNIDLAQVGQSVQSESELVAKLKASPFVKHIDSSFDPLDGTMTFQVSFENPVKFEVYELYSRERGRRLVVDLVKR